MRACARGVVVPVKQWIYLVWPYTSNFINFIYLYFEWIRGTASALSIVQHSLRGGARYTARHVITVRVLAFVSYTRNKASKMRSTIIWSFVKSQHKNPSNIPPLFTNGSVVNSDTDKATCLNHFFTSCQNVTSPPLSPIPPSTSPATAQKSSSALKKKLPF